MHLSPSQPVEPAGSAGIAHLPAKIKQVHAALGRRIKGDLYTDEHCRALYSTDASLYQIQPVAVVIPRSTADVVATVEIAREYNVPVVPRGSGTSLSGQSIVAGLVIDFSKYMNQLEIDAHRRTAHVQPGVVLDVLNAAAAKHGLQFGPDVATSSRACLGGMIGNNSAGARSIRYGKTLDHVVAVQAVLASAEQARFAPMTREEITTASASSPALAGIYGCVEQIATEHAEEILKRFPNIVRRVSGYNLDELLPEAVARQVIAPAAKQVRAIEHARFPGAVHNLSKLIVGSEGTLACVTEAELHLIPMPAARGVVVLHFSSMEGAVASTSLILEHDPSAVELLDGQIVRLAERSLEYRHYLDFVIGHPESLVLVEFSGDTADEVRASAEAMITRLEGHRDLTHVLRALESRIRDHVWACRKASLPLLMGVPGVRKPIAFVEDAAVDPVKLPQFVARFRDIITQAGTEGAFYGHASVGCLHIRPMLDPASREDLKRLQQISRDVCELVLEFGGSMSGEHGDGLARSYLNDRLFGKQIYTAFKQLKAAFDPDGIFNPGKIVDGPSPIANLRQRGQHAPPTVKTGLDFTREGGLLRAAELCNGAGVCRKLKTGTMCPSFMVTGEEEHSTRGRANALRLVLSGVLPPDDLTGERMHNTYALCLSCKGCKAECPSNVDAAKLKVEFLHQYYSVHGTPLSAKLMSHVSTINRLGSAFAPVSNWIGQSRLGSWMASKIIGINSQRPLPTFHRQNFRKWFRRHQKPAHAPRGPIVLLDDCLTRYCEPHVNRAAVQLLEAAGYCVQLADVECCGRAALSKGVVDHARALAERNVAALRPWAERLTPIVGCEPSCLLTLVDEYPELVPGPATLAVAGAAVLIDSHLIRAGIELKYGPNRSPALLHGHCHQKALIGMDDTQRTLAQIPELRVQMVDSGCCGMAGSFGYEQYDISMKIGERVLFPAVREAEHMILASGHSCRQQILHGTGRIALHPVELLAQQLADRH